MQQMSQFSSFLQEESEGITMILAGPSGAGKTGALKSLFLGRNPQTGNPWRVRVIDLDNGAGVFRGIMTREEQQACIGRVFIRAADFRDPPAPPGTLVDPSLRVDQCAALRIGRYLAKWPEEANALTGEKIQLPSLQKSTSDDIIVVDNLSRLCDLLYTVAYIATPAGADGRQIYFNAQNYTDLFLKAFFAPSAAHRILLAHYSHGDGGVALATSRIGKSQGQRIAQHCNILLACEAADPLKKLSQPILVCRPPYSKFPGVKSPVPLEKLPDAVPLATGLQRYFEALLS
jgi:hypothetical protein